MECNSFDPKCFLGSVTSNDNGVKITGDLTGLGNSVSDYYIVDSGSLRTGYLGAPAFNPYDIRVGYDVNGRGVGFTFDDLKRHIICCGLVGYGKTNFVKLLVQRAVSRGVTVTILDMDGEYSDLASTIGAEYVSSVENLELGLIPPYNCNNNIWYYLSLIDSFISSISASSELSPQMQRILNDSLERCCGLWKGQVDCFEKNIHAIAQHLPNGSKSEYSIKNRLYFLFKDIKIRKIFNEYKEYNILNKNIIFDLKKLRYNPNAREFTSVFLLGRIREEAYELKSPLKHPHIIVIEEADRIIPLITYNNPSIIASDAFYYRKNGIGLLLVTHSISVLPLLLQSGFANIVAFRIGTEEDKRILASRFGDTRTYGSLLSTLHPGEALIKTSSMTKPVLTRIEKFNPTPRSRSLQKMLDLLNENPGLCIREIRERLGLSGRRFKSILDAAVSNELVKTEYVYTGYPGRRPRVLGLAGSNPGPAHVFLERRVVEQVREVCPTAGIRLSKRRGPDIVVSYNGVTLGVEIETGSNIIKEKYIKFIKEYNLKLLIILCSKRKVCRKIKRITSTEDKIIVTNLYYLRGLLVKACLDRVDAWILNRAREYF